LHRPVFILGAPRSGTTLLYRILRTAPELAHWRPSEAHEVWELDYHPATRGWDSNVLGAEDVTPEAAYRIQRSFFLATGLRRRFVDKTPRNCLRVPFTDAIFPDATYIFLQRDGRENVNSLINAWRSPRYRTYRVPSPLAIPGVDPSWWKFVLYPGWREDATGPLEIVCARQWVISNEQAVDAAAGLASGRWITVRYETLIDDPTAEAARIAEALDIDGTDALRREAERMIAAPVNTVTPPEPGKWRRENPGEIERIEPLISDTMTRLGYGDEG
jgi:LPS sulfotransferase NodH